MKNTLRGKVAVVTGGARGIGLATVEALAREGVRVAVGDVDVATLGPAAGRAGAAFHARLDVTDAAGFRSFVDDVEAALGPVDILVNNAGIMPTGPLADEPDDVTRRMLEINTLAVVTGTKRALQTMLPRRSGHVVNVASMAGMIYMAGVASYTGSKWAVVGFTESARYEYAGSGVEFTAVLPGVVNTELVSGTASSRLMRGVEPDEVAAAIVQAVHRPRARVFVPKTGALMASGMHLTPRPVADKLLDALGGHHKFLDGVDHRARSGYESRARGS
ncbi:MAG TPA: SDR family oxidoreductase [Nocardioidaceae bacterium]|nr:SDR family oxidoreductase [Nocardioidaceae bacterium]